MEHSSISKLGRQSLVSARSKGRNPDIVRRGTNQTAENGRRHEFSLDSLDKEILQTMSRGTKNGHVSLPSDSASESSGCAQEKAICSRESSHPEPVVHAYASPEYKRNPKAVTVPNGLHSSHESTPKISKKPSEQHHGSTRNVGQFHMPTLPMCPEADVRSNGYKQQVSVNVNGGKHQQDPFHWHHSGGVMYHHSGKNNELQVSHPSKDLSLRDSHSVICNQEAEVSSSNSGEDNGEDTRRKQASEGPYSGIIGGRSQQRSALKSKVSKAPSSKWDDADKWIASPGRNDSAILSSACSSQGSAPSPLQPGKRLTITGQVVHGCNETDSSNVAAPRADSSFSLINNGITSTVNVKDHIQQIESAIQNSLVKSSPVSDLPKRLRAGAKCVDVRLSSRSDPDKRGDTSIITSTMYVQRPKDSTRLDELISPPTLQTETQVSQNLVSSIPPTEKTPLEEIPTETPIKDIFYNVPHSRSVSDFPSSISVRESGNEAAAQSNSLYRDMGTQMTPNPSVRLSRGEALGVFNNISPSRHNTPDHSRRTASVGAPPNADMLDLQNFQTDKHGRRIPSSQPHPTLDRNLNWSTREEEEAESATCLRAQDCGEIQSRPFEAWALAWEEAERAKYTARFHQEETRIKAWEEHQKARAEARMRKTEAKLEKLHESASQKMSGQIAVVNRKAEDMRAAAEVFRDEQATKAKHRAEYIRQTGNAPTTMGCFASRLVPFQSYIQ